MSIGKITRKELRKLWRDEARDFSPWLAKNLDSLNDALGMHLHDAVTEHPAGSFNVDLLANDSHLGTVVIENQLEPSDHDHLGKIITYMVDAKAKTAIWIVKDANRKHIAAIDWLNESINADFYLVKVEAIRIHDSKGDSKCAPLFTKIVGPITIQEAEQDLRYEFWTGLLKRTQGKTDLHTKSFPSHRKWLSTNTGVSDIGLNYVIDEGVNDEDWWRVDIYWGKDKNSKEESIRVYDLLFNQRKNIEDAFGRPLIWQRFDSKHEFRVSFTQKGKGYCSAKDLWPDIHDLMIETMIDFEAAIRQPLQATMQHESITAQPTQS